MHANARGDVLDETGTAELAVGRRIVVIRTLASGIGTGGSVLETLVGAAGTSERAGAVGGNLVVPSGAVFAGVSAVANVTDTNITGASIRHLGVKMAVALADSASLVESTIPSRRTRAGAALVVLCRVTDIAVRAGVASSTHLTLVPTKMRSALCTFSCVGIAGSPHCPGRRAQLSTVLQGNRHTGNVGNFAIRLLHAQSILPRDREAVDGRTRGHITTASTGGCANDERDRGCSQKARESRQVQGAISNHVGASEASRRYDDNSRAGILKDRGG